MRAPLLLRTAASAALLLAAASCVAPRREAVPAPAAPPAAPAPAPTSSDWRDLPATPGQWRWSAQASADGARFTGADGTVPFTVRCDPAARSVRLLRAGGLPDGAVATMAFTTSSGLFAYPAAADASAPGTIAASAPAGDRDLDAIAFSRGRFVVAVTGQARLVLPAAPEIGRVIEDCRG